MCLWEKCIFGLRLSIPKFSRCVCKKISLPGKNKILIQKGFLVLLQELSRIPAYINYAIITIPYEISNPDLRKFFP